MRAKFRLHTSFARAALAVFCCGLLVTVTHAQTNYQRLKSFGFPELAGTRPRAPLIEGRDGKLYGTTESSGSNDAGTVFKLNKEGSGYGMLHSFGADGTAKMRCRH
jgi:uncharacterized repeat protein (TIGR03803 family)